MKGSIGTSMRLVGGSKSRQQKKIKGMSNIFRAKYPGTCDHCGGSFNKGQSIMITSNKKPRHAYTNSCK
jgi:hypothetical protein